jgi:hypothetical protein
MEKIVPKLFAIQPSEDLLDLFGGFFIFDKTKVYRDLNSNLQVFINLFLLLFFLTVGPKIIYINKL